MIHQREIVEVVFRLPQGDLKHPAIVLSSDDAIDMEECFMAVMITTDQIDDEFSFPLNNAMFNKPVAGQARLHLIGWFKIEDIVKNSHYNQQMKMEYFKELVKQINIITFGIDPPGGI